MSTSTHQIQIKATDKTKGAFTSISSSASKAGGKIKAALGGAFAAAGAYLGVRSIANGVNEMAKFGAMARQAKISVRELSRLSTGLTVGGIDGAGPEQLAKALQQMERVTGESGLDGFYRVLRQISDIPDPAAKLQRANQVFGEMGNRLSPLIDRFSEAEPRLKTVVDNLKGLPDDLAKASTDLKSGFTLAWDMVKGELLKATVTTLKGFGIFGDGI